MLAALVSVGQGGVWAVARHSVAEMLAAAGRDGSPATVDVVVRWLVTCLVSPPTEPAAHHGAELLAQALALTGSRR